MCDGAVSRSAIIQYRLACCHARVGDDERATSELVRAIEINPAMCERAETEDALAALLPD